MKSCRNNKFSGIKCTVLVHFSASTYVEGNCSLIRRKKKMDNLTTQLNQKGHIEDYIFKKG